MRSDSSTQTIHRQERLYRGSWRRRVKSRGGMRRRQRQRPAKAGSGSSPAPSAPSTLHSLYVVGVARAFVPVSPTKPALERASSVRRLLRHGDADALHRIVHVTADIPCGFQGLLIACGISGATAELVFTGLGSPSEA